MVIWYRQAFRLKDPSYTFAQFLFCVAVLGFVSYNTGWYFHGLYEARASAVSMEIDQAP